MVQAEERFLKREAGLRGSRTQEPLLQNTYFQQKEIFAQQHVCVREKYKTTSGM